MTSSKRTDKKPGPEPERLKLDGDWRDAVKRALEREKPPEGFPPEGKKQGRQ